MQGLCIKSDVKIVLEMRSKKKSSLNRFEQKIKNTFNNYNPQIKPIKGATSDS